MGNVSDKSVGIAALAGLVFAILLFTIAEYRNMVKLKDAYKQECVNISKAKDEKLEMIQKTFCDAWKEREADIRKEAVKAGAAQWVVIDTKGNVAFQWIKNQPTIVSNSVD